MATESIKLNGGDQKLIDSVMDGFRRYHSMNSSEAYPREGMDKTILELAVKNYNLKSVAACLGRDIENLKKLVSSIDVICG